jgi:hypothetical protein
LRPGSSIGNVTAETITPNDELIALSDRELFERIGKQLDHIGAMLHEQARLLAELEPLVPLIPRALALLDPGKAMRRKWGRNAVQESASAPVPVGEASADRPPLGT